MGYYQTSAIVLDREPVGEDDLVFRVFSEQNGRLLLKARGTRKTKSKLRPYLEVFSEVNLTCVSGREFDQIISAETKSNFDGIKKKFSNISIGYSVLNLLNRLTPFRAREDKIYGLVLSVLRALNAVSEKQAPIIFGYFSCQIPHYTGIAPNISFCGKCRSGFQKNNQITFSARDGSFFHYLCQPNDSRYPADILRFFRYPLHLNQFNPSPQELAGIKKICQEFINYHL